ncbi:MAG: hypothetical protein NZ874_04825 [Fimbriimonadales bacterium]|nr:hypothetical protein [Fimbriimonadales bacterium]
MGETWLLFPERKQVYRHTAPLEVEVLREDDITGNHAGFGYEPVLLDL